MATKTGDPLAPEPFSLSRWSRRKREIAAAGSVATPEVPGAEANAAISPAPGGPATGAVAAPAAAGTPDVAVAAPASDALPSVDGLTFDSNFAAFMQPKVDESTKRAALKKLFGNPHFNVMDGLDIYVGDYTQPDPMPDGMLEKLAKVYEVIVEKKPADAVEPPPAAPVAEGTSRTETAAGPTDADLQANAASGADPSPMEDPSPAPLADPPEAGATALPPVADHALPAATAPAARIPTKRSVPE